jgi:myo-inositol-1(or 4)-monophosphatase
MTAELDFATSLARQAGDLLLDRFRLSGSRVQLKGDRSVVTEADLASDELISAAILKRDPRATVLSEELHTSPETGSADAWVVDPLDGTTNFSLGLHYWGVSIARLEDGWPVTAALYFPMLNELYSARRGKGAYLNGGRLQVRTPDPSHPASFFSCCTRTHRRYKVAIPYKTRILGSAAYSLCAVARSSALMAFEATPKIWDLAGGWLVVCEAGGVAEPFDGPAPFPLDEKRAFETTNFPVLAAATPDLAAFARKRIHPRN